MLEPRSPNVRIVSYTYDLFLSCKVVSDSFDILAKVSSFIPFLSRWLYSDDMTVVVLQSNRIAETK